MHGVNAFDVLVLGSESFDSHVPDVDCSDSLDADGIGESEWDELISTGNIPQSSSES